MNKVPNKRYNKTGSSLPGRRQVQPKKSSLKTFRIKIRVRPLLTVKRPECIRLFMGPAVQSKTSKNPKKKKVNKNPLNNRRAIISNRNCLKVSLRKKSFLRISNYEIKTLLKLQAINPKRYLITIGLLIQ